MSFLGKVVKLKRAKSHCKNLTKKAKKQHFKSVSPKGMATNNQFWDAVKPFFSNKNFYSDDHISITDVNKNVKNV